MEFSSPLLAAARVDLKSSAVELKVLDNSDSPLHNWTYLGKRWKVAETYEIVSQAEEDLIEAVVAREPVSDPRIFEAYSRVWQSYPQYLDLVPPIHRDFMDEMHRVRPVRRPKYHGGWIPTEQPEEDGTAP